MIQNPEHLNGPVLPLARQDFTTLNQKLTVQEALEAIRRRGIGEKNICFYVVDDEERLVGVVPKRGWRGSLNPVQPEYFTHRRRRAGGLSLRPCFSGCQ